MKRKSPGVHKVLSERRPGEFELIGRYLAPLANNGTSLGLKDDAAVFAPPNGHELVITKDALAEDVHFFSDDPPHLIAQKALRVNLSDLAAKGAEPVGYLLALCLPENWSEQWMHSFCDGLASDQKKYGISLFGGDTIKSPDGLVISVTAIGSAPLGKAVQRNGAVAGDIFYVTGTLGDSALGLQIRKSSHPEWDETHRTFLEGRYLLPEPRTGLSEVLSEFASAAMDVSDGVFADIRHLCEASGIGAQIRIADLPLSDAAQHVIGSDPSFKGTVFLGGDDYELLLAVPPALKEKFEQAARQKGVSVTPIGTATNETDIAILDEDGKPISFSARGYAHF